MADDMSTIPPRLNEVERDVHTIKHRLMIIEDTQKDMPHRLTLVEQAVKDMPHIRKELRDQGDMIRKGFIKTLKHNDFVLKTQYFIFESTTSGIWY